MALSKPAIDTLKSLEPLSGLTEARLQELRELCFVETVPRNADPFALGGAGETVYLLKGELAFTDREGVPVVLVGGTAETRAPLERLAGGLAGARAVTDLELLRIDAEMLDIMVTWDQLAAEAPGKQAEPDRKRSMTNWTIMSGMFSVSNLKYGVFSQLPSANIEALLDRFQAVEASRGDVIVREGAEGDYYYVIETGKCKVERMIGGVSMTLAELKSGDAFGEEALVSEARRNATVSMKTDGTLLRLSKADFIELLREPLLHRIGMPEARSRIAAGGQWVDVRYPSEYQFDRLPGAINVPLAEVRNAFGVLDREREYVLYCQSERRSGAASFLLAQRGYKAFLLAGGLWAARAIT